MAPSDEETGTATALIPAEIPPSRAERRQGRMGEFSNAGGGGCRPALGEAIRP
ncbi:MAG: hypothetical protein IIC06_05860 [Proteobacteria bacterium]|nr:hypothetical protein [Pseudomonadota bacterium]MCH8237683.1 hypothetical protein [Pseudomonadota bacterium]